MKLGDTVKDKYSDLQGVIIVDIRQIGGQRRFSVQAKNKDGFPESWEYDEVQLDLITSAENDVTPTPSGTIKQGDRVRDVSCGWEGTVTAIYLYLNGCVRYELSGRKGRFDKSPLIRAVDESLLEPVNKPPVVPTSPKRTGGARGDAPLGR